MKNVKIQFNFYRLKLQNTITSIRRRLQSSGVSINFYRTGGRWVLSRSACLGNDSLELILPIKRLIIPRINLQKNRVDHLNFQLDGGKTLGVRDGEILEKGIAKLVKKQEKLGLVKYAKPLFVFIDTYSELTDQKFLTIDGRVFFANYTDVNEQMINTSQISCKGRIQQGEIFENYMILCQKLRIRWPDVKIIFLAYPNYYESRSAFLDQSLAIEKALDHLATSLHDIKIIKVPYAIVEKEHQEDNFPYHFGNSAKEFIASEITAYMGKTLNNFG
jgi:hypothetical protein